MVDKKALTFEERQGVIERLPPMTYTVMKLRRNPETARALERIEAQRLQGLYHKKVREHGWHTRKKGRKRPDGTPARRQRGYSKLPEYKIWQRWRTQWNARRLVNMEFIWREHFLPFWDYTQCLDSLNPRYTCYLQMINPALGAIRGNLEYVTERPGRKGRGRTPQSGIRGIAWDSRTQAWILRDGKRYVQSVAIDIFSGELNPKAAALKYIADLQWEMKASGEISEDL